MGACVALYVHVRKTAIEDATRLSNGLIPANDQSDKYQYKSIEFDAFPTAHKAGEDFLWRDKTVIFLMIKSWIVIQTVSVFMNPHCTPTKTSYLV